jgi:protein-disulfide isomerase
MNKNKLLVLSTAVFFIGAFALATVLTPEKKIQVQKRVDLSSLPMMGERQAPIKMVIFEDLRCPECLKFHLEVLPKIKEKYIDTGKVKCSMVVLSFLDNSAPLALASMALFEQSSSLFFNYVDRLYHYLQSNSDPVPIDQIIADLPGVNMQSYKTAMEDGHLTQLLDKNEQVGKKYMQEDVATPTIFINGVKSKSFSLGGVSSVIDSHFKKS